MSAGGAALAAAAGGALYFLGYLGWGCWPCLLAFLVPLWRALESDEAGSLGRAALLGTVFGLSAFVGGFGWLWPLVDSFLGGDRFLGIVLWLAYGLWFAAGFAVYAIAFRALRRVGRSVALAGVPSLVVLEWLQPQLFPLYAGGGLVGVPLLVQTADLGGPLLLTALLAIANVAVHDVWCRARGLRRASAATLATTAVVLVAALGYGGWRMQAVEEASARAPALRVGVVQADLALLDKRRQSMVSHRRHLEQTRELLAAGPVDLVVWPETAYVRGLRLPLPISGRLIRGDLDVPLLFGAATVRERNGRRIRANSALLIGADGLARSAYHKNLLIPFTEYVPLGSLLPALRARLGGVQAFAAADDTPVLTLGPWRIATPICYEAIRPEFVRRMVRAGRPHLLVTLANDGWFGDSAEPWLHLGLARLRAIEHRRWLVRATNSGVSAFVDPAGRLVARSGLLTRENLRGTVHLLDGQTVYGRLGDWPGPLSAAVLLLALLWRPQTPADRA